MIFDIPQFRPGGDRTLLMYLGDEMSFDLNFLVQRVAQSIRDDGPKGIVELIPEHASILVSYDPDRISYEDLTTELTLVRATIAAQGGQELDSRIFYVPLYYFDPWTRACVDDYRAKIKDKLWDAELVVELNGLLRLDSLRRIHSSTEYWITALGFYPGLCAMLPLDPRCQLVAPKYNPPRTWTPSGAVGLGGSINCIYPDQTPGGYQIFARTPMPIWDRQQRLAAFRESLALFRPGDRVRFVPIDREEYDYIEQKIKDGTYKHPIVDYQRFSIERYRAWIAQLDPNERF